MSKLTMCLWPLTTLIILGATLFFNYVASTGLLSDLGVGQVSDRYELEITPASWTFTIWAFIYTWQILWIIYTLCLTLKYPMNTVLFGKWFYIAYNVANICNAFWIITWVNQHIVWSGIILICIAITLIATAFIAHQYIFVHMERSIVSNGDSYGGIDGGAEEDKEQPQQNTANLKWFANSQCIKAWIYILVLNGVPFYATWTVIASHLNIGVILTYKADVSDDVSSLLMLSILSVFIVAYWFLDFYKLRLYLQFTYSPYIVLIVAFCGVLSNGPLEIERPTSVFVLVLLIVAVIGTVCKVVMGISLRNVPSNQANTFQKV